MGWSIGFDSRWDRDIGYGVPARCDYPECNEEIDRGLSYVCGGVPYVGEYGCGLYFCAKHLGYSEEHGKQTCERCLAQTEPFDKSPEHPTWLKHKLTDESWATWRAENTEAVTIARAILESRK